jgi:NADPH:quinone reductase-like Zn-dependent oxidoreductase
MLNGYVDTREEYEYYSNQLFDLLKSGELKVKIHKVFPLAEVQQAHTVSISITFSFLFYFRLIQGE